MPSVFFFKANIDYIFSDHTVSEEQKTYETKKSAFLPIATFSENDFVAPFRISILKWAAESFYWGAGYAFWDEDFSGPMYEIPILVHISESLIDWSSTWKTALC